MGNKMIQNQLLEINRNIWFGWAGQGYHVIGLF